MSNKNQKSLTHFFKIIPTNDNLKSSDNMANSSHVNEKEKLSTNKRSASQLSKYVSTNPKKIHLDSPALISTSPFDISFYKNKKLDQNDIINVLNNLWKPDVQFNFPSKTYTCGKEKKEKNLKFQYSWLVRYSWLAYSPVENGAFCKFCVAFSKNEGGTNSQLLGSLVLKKFDNWKHAVENFNKHSSLAYHKQCLSDASNFSNVLKKPETSIINMIQTERMKQVLENRQNIKPIIEAIMLCGRQNMPLRGHIDWGRLHVDDNLQNNQGNFREIIRYRAQGDDVLRSILESERKVKYLSNTSQNAIIDSCNSVLLSKVVSSVNKAKCFAVLADETSDISGMEQVSLCVRYVDLDKLELREDFLQFIPTNDTTGKGLANLILENLSTFGVELKYLRGQGYDGAAAMSGRYKGVQAHIKKLYSSAIYVHCSAHLLNLVVSKSCSLQPIRNCLGVISKTRDFFVYPKRKSVLTQKIENSPDNPSKKTLKRCCETRWIERYHSVNDFLELYDFVVESLDDISTWEDSDTSGKAQCLRNSILNGEFIISLIVLTKGFGFGLPLSKQLQKINMDLRLAVKLAHETYQEVQAYRNDAENKFENIFKEASKIADKFEVVIKVPRTSNRQTLRVNINTTSAEEFYRVSVFIPYLESFANELKERFIDHETTLNSFHSLFSKEELDDDFMTLVNYYQDDLENGNHAILMAEYKLWQRCLKNLSEEPTNALQALSFCNNEIYPNIYKLLQILATLPVSTSSNERTFSNLKRIKTYLRNTIGEKRLNGLAMMCIHKDLQLTADEVLDELVKKKRKIDFVL